MKLSIVIPVYNERATLALLLEKIAAVDLQGVEREVILVDDGSSDGTQEVLRGLPPSYRVFFHEKNRGKGAALRTGFAQATGDFVIVQDADLEYDPQDYARLLQALRHDKREVIYGSRLLEPTNRRHASFPSYVGARLVTWFTNLLYDTALTDEPTCYKLFRRELLMSLDLQCDGFEFCPEVTAKIAKLGMEIKEVPIHYYPRSKAEGKKIGAPDFFAAIWTLMRERFRP